jgi:hypothetical protein
VGDNLSGGVSKWEVVVKVVDNFNHWFVKMESGDQVVKNFTHHHLLQTTTSLHHLKLSIILLLKPNILHKQRCSVACMEEFSYGRYSRNGKRRKNGWKMQETLCWWLQQRWVSKVGCGRLR